MTADREATLGRLSNGQSAAASDVMVSLGADGIEIARHGQSHNVWPYKSLTAAEPITRHAIDALLTSSHEPDATLFISSPATVRALASLAPQLSARANRWRDAKPWVIGAAGLLVLGAVLTALNISPSHAIAALLPEKARAALGKQALDAMVGVRRTCTTPAGLEALDHLSARLTRATSQVRFKIIVVDWNLMNAFAVPGEQIVMTRELIETSEGPDEVAGVLAHEMGHGLKLHPETGLIRAMGLSAGAQLLLGGNTGTLTNLGLMLAELSNSRAAEHEADLVALDLLKTSGISTRGFARFFERVLALEGRNIGSSKALALLRSHPLTKERQALVDAVPDYPSAPSLDKADWEALRNICAVK